MPSQRAVLLPVGMARPTRDVPPDPGQGLLEGSYWIRTQVPDKKVSANRFLTMEEEAAAQWVLQEFEQP